MKRLVSLALVLGLLALGGCGTSEKKWTPEVKENGGEKTLELKTSRRKRSTGIARVGEWMYVAPLHGVWWPWKMVGHGGRGAVDGVTEGMTGGKLPFLGLLFSPVNAATGFLTGMVGGFAMKPYTLNPDMALGKTFARPTATPVNVWWYE